MLSFNKWIGAVAIGQTLLCSTLGLVAGTDGPSKPVSVQQFSSAQAEGLIGITDEAPIDNPADNIFHVQIDAPLCGEEKVWLVYELDGVQDHAAVSRSVNDQVAVGGYLVKERHGWAIQREQLNAAWLREGDNVIRFTLPQDAAHSYRIRNLRIEVDRSAVEERAAQIIFNRSSNHYFFDKAYIKGFVAGVGYENVSIIIDGKEARMFNGEFETIVDFARAENTCSIEVEARHADGTTTCHSVLFSEPLTPDYQYSIDQFTYRTEKYFDANKEGTVSLHGARLDHGVNALKENATLSITSLRAVDIPALDGGMVNVTKNHAGFRFLPHGTVFGKEVNVTLPFDPAAIPDGYTENDIRTYYFDERSHHWVALALDTVLMEKGEVVSKTIHFTDMINGIIKVPEAPEVSAYNSTSMKGIKAANPTAGINLINPPQANNTGNASLGYPLDIPAGRAGMQPQLAISYNSGGGNGWMGLGWNLSLPMISIDTRWGVPRYDTDFETETYNLNGEQLTPVAHRGELQARNSAGSKRFYPRVEGAFNKIERFGNSPAGYYWVVTDKSGTKYFYGATGGNGSGVFDKQSVLRTAEKDDGGNIAQWMLSEVRDLNGNSVRYYYDKPPHHGVASGSVEGRQIYIKSISYTGVQGSDGKYKVIFTRDREIKKDTLRADVSIAANLGFKQVTADLLKKIEVQYDEQNIRSYVFRYKTGAFNKSLLSDIKELDSDGKTFTTHTLDYYDEVDFKNGYKPFKELKGWQIDDGDGIVRGDFLKRIEGEFDDNASMLSGSKSKDNSFGMAVSVGFNPRVTDKTFSVGGSFSKAGSESEGMLTMMDLNGDGLSDKVFIKDGLLHYSPNLSGTGERKFGKAIEVRRVVGSSSLPINAFFKEKSKTVSGGLEAHGPAYAPLFGGYSRSKTKSEQTVYFTEVNGDQLPDLVDRGKVYFSRINPNTGDPEFVESSSLTPSPIVQGENISTGLEQTDQDALQQGIKENPLHDIVKRWQAPHTGRIKITAPVQLLNIQDDERAEAMVDGVRVAIQLNGEEMWSATIDADDYDVHTPTNVNDIVVNTGDRIYFRTGSVFNGGYDQVLWSPVIEYTSLPFDLKQDVNDQSYVIYDSKMDFKLSATQKISVPEKGTIRIDSRFIKPTTTDDVQLEIIRETTDPNDAENPDKVISTDTVFLKQYSWKDEVEKDTVLELAVDEGHHFQFKVHTNTNVNWADVDWKPHLYYTALSDPQFEDQQLYNTDGTPIIEFYPVIEYTMHNEEVKMSKPFKVEAQQDTITVQVTPVITLREDVFPFVFDGDIYFSVKKKNALVYKDTIIVENNRIVSDSTTASLKVLKGDSLYMEYHVVHIIPRGADADVPFGLADMILVSKAGIVANKDTVIVEAGVHKEIASGKIFGPLFHQWGHFAYNSNDASRATTAIVESDLKLNDNLKNTARKDPNDFKDGNDLKSDDTYKPYEDKFIVLVPMGKQQSWIGYDNDIYVSAQGASSSRMGDNDPKASASTSAGAGTGARAISKKTESTNNSYSLGANAVVGGASATYSDGTSKVITDYTDFNGDRYPDIVVGNRIQFTDAQGGLSSLVYTHPDANNSESTTDAMGYSLSGSFTTSKGEHGISKKIGKSTFSIGDGKSSAGLSANKGLGHNSTDFLWMDINGDGLPDRVSPTGVRLNLGYSFADEEPWDHGIVQKGESTNEGAGLGISLWGGSISGGISLARSDNEITGSLQDVNGDGLVDLVTYQGVNQSVKVRFNDGNGFTAAVDWTGAYHIGGSSSSSQSANVAFTAGIYIPPPFNIKITVNPSYSNGHGASRELSKLSDVNGDGYPDYVISNKYDELYVAPSAIGRTNLLKEVQRPLGATFTMAYRRVGNTYELPNSTWVLDSVKVFDGFAGDGVDSMATAFAYEDGRYDRHEREFFGFGKVITSTIDTKENANTVYTTVTQTFAKDSYYEKGLLLSEVMTDGEGNKYVAKSNHYELKDISSGVTLTDEQIENDPGNAFPALIETVQMFYEGQSDPGKQTSTEYKYDRSGNVTDYIDHGDDTPDDDLHATITYHNYPDKYLIGAPEHITVKDGTKTLRERRSVIDPSTGNVTQIKQFLSEDEIAVYDMQYDQYGNLEKIIRPENERGERLSFVYKYDEVVHTYPTNVSNSYGYSSEADYDYGFGQVLMSKDLNGNEITYELDAVGRVQYITGPYEKGSGNKTIEFEYHPEAQIPWALTKHYDPSDPQNKLETEIFVDGLGRVLQTKKDVAIFQGEGKADTEMMSVSGRVEFDAFGRAVSALYPVTEAKDDAAGGFNDRDKDAQDPTLSAYDVLNRTVKVTLPDKAVTETVYGFGSDRDGNNQFSTKTTDANGKQTEQFTDVRGRVTAVKNYTAKQDVWTSFKYNAINEQVEATNDLGHTTFSTYDNLGRRTTRIHPDAGQTNYFYDLAGNLIELQTANLIEEGLSIDYVYDRERLVEIHYPQNTENNVKYTYGEPGASDNRAGRIVVQEDGSGAQEFFYGPLGEVVKNIRTVVIPQHDEQTYTTQWTYDTWNRLTSMTYPDGEKVAYNYNSGGLLRSMTGKKKGTTFNYVNQLGYDKFEQRVYLEYGNGTKTHYEYEPDRRRLHNMTAQTKAKRLFMDNVYTYDKVNNIKTLINKAPIPSSNLMGGSSTYSYDYDDLYRLTTAEGSYEGSNEEHRYTLSMDYNSVGGIMQKTQLHKKGDQEQKKTTYDLAYGYGETQPNAPIHIGDQTYIYDANGNQTGWTSDISGQKRKILWDEENRIRSIYDNGSQHHYIYDAAGERVLKGKSTGQRIFLNGEWKAGSGQMGNYTVYVNPYLVLKSGGYTKHYYIESQRIVSKLGGGWDSKNSVKAGGNKVDYVGKTQKVFDGIVKNLKFLGADGQILTAGKSGKIPPGQVSGMGSVTEAFRYFYHPDHLGSTSYVTDASGEVYQHIEYFAFGETFVEEHSNTNRTPYLFNGKELDEETGLYNYGARYYDPKTGIFLSVDPLVEKMPNVSPYAYCFNNPIRFTDPQGLEPDERPKPNIWQRVKAFFGIGRIMGSRTANNQRYVNHGNLRGKFKHNGSAREPQNAPTLQTSSTPDPQPQVELTPDPLPETPQPQNPPDTPEPPQENPVIPPLPCVPQKFDLSFNWVPNQAVPQDRSFALGQLQTIADQWNGCNNYSQVSITVYTPLSVSSQFMTNTKAGVTNNTLMYNRAQWIQRQLNGQGIGSAAFLNSKGQRRLFINWGIPRGSTPSSNVTIK